MSPIVSVLSYVNLLEACVTFTEGLHLPKFSPSGACLDGDKGGLAGIKKLWPSIHITRCLAHVSRNIVDNWPKLFSAPKDTGNAGKLITGTYRTYSMELRRKVCALVRILAFLPTFLEFREARTMIGNFLRFAQFGGEEAGIYILNLPDELYSGLEKVRRKNGARLRKGLIEETQKSQWREKNYGWLSGRFPARSRPGVEEDPSVVEKTSKPD